MFEGLKKNEIKKVVTLANKELDRNCYLAEYYAERFDEYSYHVYCGIGFYDSDEPAEIKILLHAFLPDRRRSSARVIR